jgi:hypothetical protein
MSWKVKARARKDSWDLGKSGDKECVAVLFDYVDQNGEAGSIQWWGYFTDKTWERTLESLRYMGWQGDDLGSLDSLDANEVELVLDEEEYQGKKSTKVQWVNRLQALYIKDPMDQGERASFAARMRGRIAQHNQQSGQRRATTSQPRNSAPRSNAGFDTSAPMPEDDDLRF